MKKSSTLLLPTEAAWLAGFIDGEGYIGITFQRKKETRTQAPSPRYHPYLIIANTDKRALDSIVIRTGMGRIHSEVKREGCKPSYQYQVTKRDQLYDLLDRILPYLRIK